MPCYDPYMPDDTTDFEAMFCEAMQVLEAKKLLRLVSKDVRDEWKFHKQRDAERVREELDRAKTEKQRKAVLKKMTDHEKRLLGLDDSL